MKRLKVVSDWAARVLENGPREARDMAEDILDEVNRMILFHRDRDPGDLLDELADDCLEFCLGHYIKAPPGIHGRLLENEDYRERVKFMRGI